MTSGKQKAAELVRKAAKLLKEADHELYSYGHGDRLESLAASAQRQGEILEKEIAEERR